MSEINKTYRIRTNVNTNDDYITLDANLVQDYDAFDILSVKIDSVDTYKLHNADYGVVVGRVLANNGFGVPNAKISIFIPSDGEDGEKVRELYPFSNIYSKNKNGVRYNLLPDDKVNDCHQVVGTFPNKRYALDNDVMLEVFEKYYKYTVRTNNSGDYLIMGVPVGAHTLHMDLDLSDCGILSQRPRDFVYKGYTIEQFENPNMFKKGTNYDNLSQIFTQNQVVNVQPFWGNSSLGEKIGITRADINISFKFEPTCVFMGSVVSDNSSQGISKKCVPTENMGNMEELTTGEGTIEMIRKTMGGGVEEFQIKGTQLIDGNGVWCYQIPMNLDYMMTDEYGNMVPTDNPDKGIPTRARVRFRISMGDNEQNLDNYFRAKVLVPHNPQMLEDGKFEEYDYDFGTYTNEESFRDLFWNNVYSVKSYIPRFQKRKTGGWKEKKFTGIKNCNFYGSNNPMPYNNIRIKLPFIFTVMCAIIKVFIFVVSIMNTVVSMLGNFLSDLGDTYIGFHIWKWDVGVYPFKSIYKKALSLSMTVVKEGLCPDLENWYFAPMFRNNLWTPNKKPPKDYQPYDLLKQTLNKIRESSADDDKTSIDVQNNEENDGEEPICLTIYTDYLISCVEMNLAMEYKVINFDFYNDWVNGVIYFPRFMRYVKPKKTFFGKTIIRSKIKGCMDDPNIFSKTRRYTHQCSLGYKSENVNGRVLYTNVDNPIKNKKSVKKGNNFHKQRGLTQTKIFGSNGGVCHEHSTLKGQHVYYLKPCEWTTDSVPINKKVNLFATDIILLGSLSDCDLMGIPQAYKYLSSTSYIMPTNLALTNMESNGYLYATSDGVLCTGSASLSENEVRKGAKVNVVPPSCGLTAELMAYSGAQDSNYNVQYDGNELSDIIALTEAAGISWNYTGPGQGVENAEKMYHPGGHFLGLSCVNSMTNIKSCINLTRICEVGANMSQRKEDITSLDKNGNPHYSYTVPSGFISGDDIVGADFRAMFATMNQKRLLATKINPTTGYKIYDMDFVKPINFDGAFKNVVSNAPQYNCEVEVPEEDSNFLEKIGITFNMDARPDHDQDEYTNTQTRTIESPSIDYYLYRMGLKYEELTKTNQKHLRKFLYSDSGYMYLPQYENSYYFYFGLKNGATALDEFNKQFFSVCDNGMLVGDEPTLNIFVNGEFNMCEAKADIIVNTTNLDTPYQYVEILSDVEFIENDNGDIVKGILITNGDEEIKYDSWLTNYSFELSGCPFGTYKVTIRDANDVVITKTQKIGYDVISFESDVYNFNSISEKTICGEGLEYRGGYIKVSNLVIEGIPIDETIENKKINGTNLTVFVKDQDDKTISSATTTNGNNEKTLILGVNKVGSYNLMVKYKCGDNNEKDVEFLLQTFKVENGSSLELRIGAINGMSKQLKHDTHEYGWWENINDNDMWVERVSTFNEETDRKNNSSSIKVYAVDGNKIVWGLPQNSEGLWPVVASNEDNDIEPGYTVDDEYYHWPTYRYEDGKEKPHFSALVYKNNIVMGDYYAVLMDGTIKGKTSSFKKNCGYIFKPIPNGDLQFRICEKDGELTYENVDGEKIEKGLFYPSISYPSINRPFNIDASFYCWNRRALETVTDESGEESLSVMDYEEGGKTELKISNGITYDNKFFSSSTITNIANFGEYKVEVGDMDGIDKNKDRVITVSGYNSNIVFETLSGKKCITKGESGITTYSFDITEGYPDGGASMVNSIADEVDSAFADYVMYSVEEANGGKYIAGPFPNGGVKNGDAEYYMACFKDDDRLENMLVKSKDKYVYKKIGDKTYHVFCTYTSDAENNTEGAPLIAKIIRNKNSASCSFSLYDANKELYTHNSGDISINKDDSISVVFDTLFDICTQIRGVIDYRINTNISDWSYTLDKDKKFMYKNGDENQGYAVYSDSRVYYAFGVTTGYSGSKLYKIYPTIVKISEYVEEDFDPTITYVDKDYKIGDRINVRVSHRASSISLTINDCEKTYCKISSNKDWVSGEPAVKGESIDYTLKINSNPNGAERGADVYFEFASDKQIIMFITQQGDPSKPDWRQVSDYRTKEVYGDYYLNGETGSTKLLLAENITLNNGDYRIYLPLVDFKTMTGGTEYDANALLYVKNFTFVLEGNKGGIHKLPISGEILVQNKGENKVEISGQKLEVLKLAEADTYKLYIEDENIIIGSKFDLDEDIEKKIYVHISSSPNTYGIHKNFKDNNNVIT